MNRRLAVLTITIILLLVGGACTSTQSHETSAPTFQTAVPSPTVDAMSLLRNTQWATAHYPFSCTGFGYIPQRVVYLEFSGTPSAVVLVACHAGAGTPPSGLYVFQLNPNNQVAVAFSLLRPKPGGYQASSFTVQGPMVTMRVYGFSSASIPNCCPDVIRVLTWRWTGSGFSRSSKTLRYPTPSPTPTSQLGVNGNPWGFNFSCCQLIYQAQTPSSFCSYFICEGAFFSEPGYIVECADGEYGHAGGISGSCSYHGGNLRALLRP
jgi:hypothetical protein